MSERENHISDYRQNCAHSYRVRARCTQYFFLQLGQVRLQMHIQSN